MPASQARVKDVSQENRQDHPVVQHLQREVANAFVLYANYKHYHWQTDGPLFRELHLLFDEFAEHVLGTIDEMAERVRMIGQDLQSVQLTQYQQNATIQSAQAGQSMREMVEEADANLLIVIKGMRQAAKAAEENEDPGTVDLFSKTVANSRERRVVSAPAFEETGWISRLSPIDIIARPVHDLRSLTGGDAESPEVVACADQHRPR